jgi:O-antigen ligase
VNDSSTRRRLWRCAGAFDGLQTFGLVVLLFGLPVGESVKSIGLALAIAGFVGKLACGKAPAFRRRGSVVALGALFLIATLSVAFAEPALRKPFDLVIRALVLVVFPLVLDACQRRSRTLLFAWAIVAGAAVAAVMGYAGFIGAEVRHRLALPSIENAVPAGEYLAAAAVVAAALLWFEWRARVAGPLLWLSTAATVGALVLTKTRGAFAGAAAGFACLLALLSRRRYALALLVVAAVGAWVFVATHPEARVITARYQIDARFVAWKGAIEKVGERPVLGHGLGSFDLFGIVYRDERVVEPQLHAHNDLLQAASETGLLGAGALALFLVLGIRDVLRSVRSVRRRLWRAVSCGALGGAVVLIAAGLGATVMGGETGTLLLALLAIGAAAGEGTSS